jgi:Icc-related predicted phosphoesterase
MTYYGIALMAILIVGVLPFMFQNAKAWELCTVGDLTDKAVLNKMKAYNCSIDVLLGDYYGKESTYVKGFVEPGVPVLAACGNHDDCDNVGHNDNIKGDQVNYGFRWKGIGFLILNTEESINSQKAKAEGLLTKWQNDNNITQIVIAQHKPAITTPGAHHKESEAKGYRAIFEQWADKYSKLDLLLAGHNHNYLVCKPDKPGVLAITEGTGGRSAYPIGSSFDDGCEKSTSLSGSKYNGFSVIEMGNPIKYKHISAN